MNQRDRDLRKFILAKVKNFELVKIATAEFTDITYPVLMQMQMSKTCQIFKALRDMIELVSVQVKIS